MIDSKNTFLRKNFLQDTIQLSCRFEITTKRFFHNHAGILRTTRSTKLTYDARKETRGDSQIMNRSMRCTEFYFQLFKRCGVAVVSIDVTEMGDKRFKADWIEATVFSDARPCSFNEFFAIPSRSGHAYDREIELASTGHRLQCWKNFLVGQISCGPKENERIRPRLDVFTHLLWITLQSCCKF